MKELTFTIQHCKYIATVALAGKWTLYEFAQIITNTVGFAFDHAFEFCNDLENPYDSTERYSLFADEGEPGDDEAPDPGVANTLVADVFQPGKAMLFHFDYGDDWYFLISCTGGSEIDVKRRQKKVLSTVGTPPEQYPECE